MARPAAWALVTRGNGVSTAYGYDGAWRLNALSQCLPSNPSPCAAANANYQNETFTSYNPANQLMARSSSNSAFSQTATAASTIYTVNGQNQLKTAHGNTISYDGRGNLTSDSANSYSFDADNNLTAVNGAATLTSDPLGRLSLITDLSGGAATTGSRFFRYSGPDLLAEYGVVGSDAGVLHRRYVPGPGTDEVVVWYDSADTTMRRWLLTDRQGSVTAVTDVNANVLAVNTYDEYGAPPGPGPGNLNLGRFQYTGQIWIPELGLYHYKARDYSPYLGRFMQTDPIGYKDGLNWYAYVGDDPVDGSDPSGDDCVPGTSPLVQNNHVGGRANPGCPQNGGKDAADSISAGFVSAGKTMAKTLTVDGAEEGVGAATGPGDVVMQGVVAATTVVGTGIAVYQVGKPIVGAVVQAVAATVHGNDLSSSRSTVVYQLVDRRSGDILKYGITSELNPRDRYSSSYYQNNNAQMEVIARYRDRRTARVDEIHRVMYYFAQHGALPPLSLVP
jgi:RHS repeat-associated protein